MHPTNSLSIRNENVGEAIRKLAPRDVTKFNGISLRGDFLGENLGLGAVEKHDSFGIFGGELGSGGDRGDREEGRRRVGDVRIGGVFAHVGDALDGPATVALEAFDLAPQIRIEREKGSVFVGREAKQRVRVRGFV